MDPVARRRAYDCEITYGTNSEFGFDYLRDNMKPARWADNDYDPWYQQVQKALNFAIIDEVDNILIDEARTPLIHLRPAFGDLRRYAKANDIAIKLRRPAKTRARSLLRGEREGTYLPPDRRGHPQGRGVGRRREFLTRPATSEWPHLIDNALRPTTSTTRTSATVVMRHPESAR